MPRNRAGLTVRRIPVDGMTTTFSKELAAMFVKMTKKVDALHSTGTANDSRTT